jgi:hypothetical protein
MELDRQLGSASSCGAIVLAGRLNDLAFAPSPPLLAGFVEVVS